MNYFQKAVGYSLLGDNREQVMFICHGKGANGKSLLLETIREVFGSYGQSVPVSALMAGKANGGAANPEIARLRGVRFALASETESWCAHTAHVHLCETWGTPLIAPNPTHSNK